VRAVQVTQFPNRPANISVSTVPAKTRNLAIADKPPAASARRVVLSRAALRWMIATYWSDFPTSTYFSPIDAVNEGGPLELSGSYFVWQNYTVAQKTSHFAIGSNLKACSSWSSLFIGVWTAVHRTICRTMSSQSALLCHGSVFGLRPSCISCCGSHSMEQSPCRIQRPDNQRRLLPTAFKDSSIYATVPAP